MNTILYYCLIVISVIIAIIIGIVLKYPFSRVNIPTHLCNHPAVVVDNLIDETNAKELLALFKTMKTFPSNVDQAKGQGFVPYHEDAGEGMDIEEDGSCKHPFLVPNLNRTKCILPQRVDIGIHYISTGGLDGTKESYHSLVDRVNSFGRYTFVNDLDKYPPVKQLFQSEKFQLAAQSVCPQDKKYLDPFQFNFIIQVPGQTVAVHIDVPYFWGAGRKDFPQWLLAVMMFSGLWEDKFINQVQVVGYLHEWNEINDFGGDFVYYNNNTSNAIVTPKYRSGSIIDGSKTLHAAKVYQPNQHAPHFNKDKENKLEYLGNDNWRVISGENVILQCKTSDLRISVVYRARCFESKEESIKYNSYDHRISLQMIIDTLVDNLIQHGRITQSEINKMNKVDLNLFLIKSYIHYPLPPYSFPYNYCALGKLIPWTEKFISLICN